MQPQGRKHVNIILKEIKNEEGTIVQRGGIILRVSEKLALHQTNKGAATYTSKQKLKSAFKREQRVNRNMALLSKQGYKKEGQFMVSGNTKLPIYFDPTNGKMFVITIVNNIDSMKSKLNIGFYQRQMPISYNR